MLHFLCQCYKVNWRIILHFEAKKPKLTMFQIAYSRNYTLLQYAYCVLH